LPYRKCDIEDFEKVQKRATSLLPELKGRNYIDRLKACKLPTLHYRRIWGDMIETYKIVSGKYDNLAAPMLPSPHSHVTQGHDLRLKKNRARYDLRKCKFFFTNRVVNIWNSLPDCVVHADTVNCFKSQLDTLWSNPDLVYNFKAEISGTGSQSRKCIVNIIQIRNINLYLEPGIEARQQPVPVNYSTSTSTVTVRV